MDLSKILTSREAPRFLYPFHPAHTPVQMDPEMLPLVSSKQKQGSGINDWMIMAAEGYISPKAVRGGSKAWLVVSHLWAE